jgi:DNA-binding transcriptional regulator YdaS (Cro superfamily)
MVSLREYLFYSKISVTDFARNLEVSRSYLNQIVLENMKPSKRLAKDIEEATNGKVTVKELLKDE